MTRFREAIALAWEIVQRFNASRSAFLAAALSYFLFFALFPLLLLLVALAGQLLSGEDALRQTLQFTREVLPQQGPWLEDTLRGVMAHRGEASLLGLAGLLWSGKNVFGCLSQALNMIGGYERDRGLIFENGLQLLLTLGIGVGIAVVGAAYAILMAILSLRFPILGFTPAEMPGLVFLIASLFPVTLVALVMGGLYRILPAKAPGWEAIWPGATVAAVGWEAFRRLFGYYLTNVARYDAVYGSLSAIVGLMFWLYASSLLFLLGGIVAQVLDARNPLHEPNLKSKAQPTQHA